MKINETRKRSLLKAISFRVIEIAIDTGILWLAVTFAQPLTPLKILVVSIIVESCCMGVHYCFERQWNKSNYGREIL